MAESRGNKMIDNAKSIFNGKCPYTNQPCLEKIPCKMCLTDKREKALMEKLNEDKELEILYEEMERLK